MGFGAVLVVPFTPGSPAGLGGSSSFSFLASASPRWVGFAVVAGLAWVRPSWGWPGEVGWSWAAGLWGAHWRRRGSPGGRRAAVHLHRPSAFFGDLLLGIGQPHPVIFMRGLTRAALAIVVNFVCLGEAEVRGEGLDGFQSLAGGLGVGGMTSQGPQPLLW